MNRRNLTAVTSLAALFVCAGLAHADFLQPVGVSSTSYWTTGIHHTNLIDGSGLSAENAAATHGTANGDLWHTRAGGWGGGSSGAPVVDNQEAIFDLGGLFDITNAYIWNMNQAGGAPTNGAKRSINQYDLDVSSDGVNWTTVIVDGNLVAGTGNSNITANNVALGTQTDVRFVRIGADTAGSAAANEYVGLSEVRFEGTQTAAGPMSTAAYAANTTLLPESVSSTDLLQGKSATSTGLLTGAVGQLTDGVGAPAGGPADFGKRIIGTDGAATLWQLDYSFDGVTRIDEINLFSFNTDARREMDFDVLVSTDFGASYQYLAIGATNVPVTATGNTSVVNLDQAGAMSEFATDLRFILRPINGLGTSLVEIDALGASAEKTVTLQNATAIASQTTNGGLTVDRAIDGLVNSGDGSGWGNGAPGTFTDNAAAFETTEDLNFAGEAVLHFTMDFTSFSDHGLGRFRLLATTADRDEFADGLANGGDVDFTGGDTGEWVVLDNLLKFEADSGLLLAGGGLQPDGSFLIDDLLGPGSDQYNIWLRTDLSGITGFRLEILDDASLAGGGPGLSNSNGNSVLTEFSVKIASVPTPAALPAGLVMIGALAARRRRMK